VKLGTANIEGFNSGIPAIVGVGFSEPCNLGGHKTTVKRVSFFVSALGLQLVYRVLGGIIPAGSLGCRFANPTLGMPFLFSDEKGVYINLGANTMADQQNNSQKKITTAVFTADEKLSEAEHRLRFIMDTLCASSSDWIQESAATGLYYTIESIADKIKDVRSTVLAEVRA